MATFRTRANVEKVRKMIDIDELTFTDTARRLGVSVRTIYNAYHHGTAKEQRLKRQFYGLVAQKLRGAK